MFEAIATIAGAITAICGIITILYKYYWSPKAKLRRKALENGRKAVDNGDVSGVTDAFDKLRR